MNPTSSSPFLRFLCLFTIFISFVAAIKDGSKSYLVTFDKDTPQSVVNKAANDLRKNVRLYDSFI